MEQAIEIIIPLAAFALVFGIVYVGVTAMHRKEIAMIEAGMNPNEKKRSGHSVVRTAFLILLVPAGIFVGNVIGNVYPEIKSSEPGLLFAFIFGGIALTASYFVDRYLKPKSKSELS